MTSKLVTYKVKDTGVELLIKKVSPALLREFTKLYPTPKPPTQEVWIGDATNGHVEVQENRTHPDYIATLADYSQEFQEKLNKFLIKRGVVIDLTPEQKEEVDQLRREWKEDTGTELDGDDKYVYVIHIAIGTEQDFEELTNAIWRRTDVTQEAVDEAVKSFRN